MYIMPTQEEKKEQLRRELEELFSLLRFLNPSLELQSEDKLLEIYNATILGAGDELFQFFGAGNVGQSIDRPFERTYAYELLLAILQKYDPEKYKILHKGTPYYFLGWTAFDFREYERAVYYMDAAVSEDIRIQHLPGRSTPTAAMQFFFLTERVTSPAVRVHAKVYHLIKADLDRFNSESGLSITVDDFSTKFIKRLLLSANIKERSIVTALYGFLLQFHKLKQDILLRSTEGGSIEPWLNHLFDGARLFESLLELKTGNTHVLRTKLNAAASQLQLRNVNFPGGQTLENAIAEYNRLVTAGDIFQDCNIHATYIVRNTTGHSLLWTDQFVSADYDKLFHRISNSLFWTIYRYYIA
jgi:hypothetical protein